MIGGGPSKIDELGGLSASSLGAPTLLGGREAEDFLHTSGHVAASATPSTQNNQRPQSPAKKSVAPLTPSHSMALPIYRRHFPACSGASTTPSTKKKPVTADHKVLMTDRHDTNPVHLLATAGQSFAYSAAEGQFQPKPQAMGVVKA